MNAPLPGWYPDPETPGNQRYWDGHRWGVTAAPLPSPQPRRKGRGVIVLAAVLMLCGGCMGLVVLGGGHSSSPVMDTDGTYYEVGDRSAGTYETAGSIDKRGRPCSWTRTRRPTIEIADMIAVGEVGVGEHARVTLSEGEYFVSYRCAPWRKVP